MTDSLRFYWRGQPVQFRRSASTTGQGENNASQFSHTPIPGHQLEILHRMEIAVASAEVITQAAPPDLIIDGIIGYSLKRDPRGPASDLSRWANRQGAPILALDVPSGATTSQIVMQKCAILDEFGKNG